MTEMKVRIKIRPADGNYFAEGPRGLNMRMKLPFPCCQTIRIAEIFLTSICTENFRYINFLNIFKEKIYYALER
jgi:hypothetical protein